MRYLYVALITVFFIWELPTPIGNNGKPATYVLQVLCVVSNRRRKKKRKAMAFLGGKRPQYAHAWKDVLY